MVSTLLIALVVAAPPQSPHPSAPAATGAPAATKPAQASLPAQAPRSVQQLRAAVSETLRREAVAKDATERRAATGDLIALATEVRDHPQLSNSVGKGLLGRIQNRLRRIAQKIKRDLARRDARQRRDVQRRRPANVNLHNQGDDVRAQAGLGGNQNGFNQPGDAAQQPGDDGEKLVELIEQVIAPASWEINGGKGVIVYFRSRRVVVVRQRGEVHNDLAGLIEDLNAP